MSLGLGPFKAGGAVRAAGARKARPAMGPSTGGRAVGLRPKTPPAPAAPGGAQAAPAVGAPWDPIGDARVAGLNASADVGLAGLVEAEKFLRLDYGLIQDASGNFQVDVGNPQAKAAMLQRSYQQARRGDLNSMAGRGQLQSGAYLRQLEARNTGEQGDFSALTSGFSRGLAEIGRRRDEINAGLRSDTSGVRLDSAERIANDSRNTVAPPGAATPKAGYQFVQKDGPRAGMSYKLVRGPKGKLMRLFENGDKIAR